MNQTEQQWSEIVRKLDRLERRLDALQIPERGWIPHFFTNRLTNEDFNGDWFSTVGSNTKIENTSWSETIPTRARALSIRCYALDTGSSAGGNIYFALYSASTASNGSLIVSLGGVPDANFRDQTALMSCTDGDIWYRASASGVNTLSVQLFCFGWWE